jgi:hypothetical protein
MYVTNTGRNERPRPGKRSHNLGLSERRGLSVGYDAN